MRLILKLFALPFALALTAASALFSLAVAASDKLLGVISGLVFIAAVVLLITGQTAGGVAFMAVAFLIGGLAAFAGWLAEKLGSGAGALRAFIFS